MNEKFGKSSQVSNYYIDSSALKEKDFRIRLGVLKTERAEKSFWVNEHYRMSQDAVYANALPREGFIFEYDMRVNENHSAIIYRRESQSLLVRSPLQISLTIAILIGKGIIYNDRNSQPFLEMDKIVVEIEDTSPYQRLLTLKERSFNFQQAKTAIRLNSPNANFEDIKVKWEAYLYLTQILQVVKNRSISEFVDFYSLKNWDAVNAYRQNNPDISKWEAIGHFKEKWIDHKKTNPEVSICQLMESVGEKT